MECKDSTGNDPYAWQDSLYKLFSEVGFRGIIDAKPSAGKSRGACKILKSYLDVFGESEVWIVGPNNAVLDVWTPYIEEFGFDVKCFKPLGAVKHLSSGQKPDFMIIDECQFVNSPEWGKILNYGVPHLLGLSGTPEGSEKRIGPIFFTRGWEEVNIAPTTIHYITFTPSVDEMKSYRFWTHKAEEFKEKNTWANIKNSDELRMIYLNRRRASHRMASRLPIALELIKLHLGERTMVFCELTKQVKDLSKLLTKHKIAHCVHITGKEELDKFKDGEADILLSVKMVSEGFSDTSISCGIAVSSASSERSHVQEIGRIIRPKEGKKSNIYALLANGTSDDQIMKKNDFTKENIVVLEWEEWSKQLMI